MSDETVYYRADVPGLKRGDPATRTLDVIDEEEYTYATTRLDVARGIAARNTGYLVYRVLLNEPIEADPGAARDGVGDWFVRAPSGAVVHVADEKAT